MAVPSDVTGQEVVVGGGAAALTYCATRVAMGFKPPVLIEKRKTTGGMFAQLSNFRMNSANGASVESVAAGPTRIPSRSPSDDLNWLPNAPYQLRDIASAMSEYPYSSDMAKAIQKGLDQVADVYTSAEIFFDRNGACYTKDGSVALGRAKRVIWAAGYVEPPDLPQGKAIMSGYAFLAKPVRDLAGKKIALVGGGDTAAQSAEYLLGQGFAVPVSMPSLIHWYGGDQMPERKEQWMQSYHARFAGVARGLQQQNSTARGVITTFAVRGETTPLGDTAMVNGQVYDLAIHATGFVAAACPVSASSQWPVAGMFVARYFDDASGAPRVFRVGTAAGLNQPYRPYQSRFPAAVNALYNQLPRVAMLAATLP